MGNIKPRHPQRVRDQVSVSDRVPTGFFGKGETAPEGFASRNKGKPRSVGSLQNASVENRNAPITLHRPPWESD